MKYCIIKIKTQTASFRNPEFQNFHKTLPLPPPTTIVGIAGAAMGKSPEESQRFFEETAFEMGTYCRNAGTATDLWKYNDFSERSIILKEFLFQNDVILIYGSDDSSKIDTLIASFENPVYVLTLGNSDSLAKVVAIKEETKLSENDFISHCLVEGDIIDEVLSNASNGLDFSIYSTSDPVAMDLPTRFSYADGYGMRSVCQRKQFSLITSEMKLNVKKKGILYKGTFVPLFTY
jgi:CRISPR-associated protein Cas5t